MKRKKNKNNTSRYRLTVRDYRGEKIGSVENPSETFASILDAVGPLVCVADPHRNLHIEPSLDRHVWYLTRVWPSWADPRPDLRWSVTVEPLDPRGISGQLLKKFNERETP